MKYAVIAAAAAASFIVPAQAQEQDSRTINIVAPQHPTRADWAHKLGENLDRALKQVTRGGFAGGFSEDATVSVGFNCDERGVPSDITLIERSGSRTADRAGMRAIARLRNLHPLPAGMKANQAVRANIIFATSHESLARQTKALSRREAARALAEGPGQPLTLSLRMENAR